MWGKENNNNNNNNNKTEWKKILKNKKNKFETNKLFLYIFFHIHLTYFSSLYNFCEKIDNFCLFDVFYLYISSNSIK